MKPVAAPSSTPVSNPNQPSALPEHITVNGAVIFSRALGRGPDVVVLHGGPGADHATLLPQFDSLARNRRLLYYDQRGSGNSSVAPGAALGWRQHVDDLDLLLDHWQCPAATLLGYSWGGLLALLYTVRHPTRVNRLALISPAPVTARGREEFIRRLNRRLQGSWLERERNALEVADLRHREPNQYRQRLFELSITPYLRNPDQARHVKRFVVSSRVRDAVWRSLAQYDLTAELSRLAVPALVIHGRCDPIPLSSSERTADLLSAQLAVFEQSAHLPFLEEFERFVAVLDGFLPRDRS